MPDTVLPSATRSAEQAVTLDSVIVGAGFAGLYQLYCLRDRLGLNAVVLEAGGGVGGTWYWNRYPGARCDSESHSYAYFFSRELHEEWEWSERYPEPPEVVGYLNHVADKFDLKRDIRFNTRVTSAHYDDDANVWQITTESGAWYRATWLITAVGCLSSANIPDFPGRDSFRGESYHTGQWPHDGVDFAGKRVGQIGTGSTGIQAAPVIAETAGHLTVFQRTANYSVPARNAPLSADFKRQVRDNYDDLRELVQSTPNGHAYRISERNVAEVSESERETIYEAAWQKGGLQFRGCFRDIVFDKAANDTAANFIKAKIRAIVKDPQTADLLTEFDHPYSTKRPPIDTAYFETFNRENVSLVNVRTNPIAAITPHGVRLEDGTEHALDVIVYATGFDAMTGPLLNIDIRGREGLPLREVWNAGPRTFLGLQVTGFPNMFNITGPGSPSVLCNMPVAIEQHVEWIADCIAHMRRNGVASIETTEDSTEKWVAHVNDAAHATLMPFARNTWYFGANIPGKPRVFMPYAGGMNHYRAICDDIAGDGYKGFVLRYGGQRPPEAKPVGAFSLSAWMKGPGV